MMRRMLGLAALLAMGCAMDGGPGLVLDRAWWRHPGVLRVALWTDMEGAFELEEDDGRLRGEAACRNERCVVTFVGASEPRYLWERVEHLERGTPLLECGVDPFGLCPFGQTCVDRACVPMCSPLHLDGACIEDGARCVGGACAIPES